MSPETLNRPLVLDVLKQGRFKANAPPRNNGRAVPMKLLCLGHSRTGTQSLREALFILGYDDVYHQTSLNVDYPADVPLWNKALRAKFEGQGDVFDRHKFDQLLGHCMAVTDVPCVIFWRELMDAYPEAIVVLTVRDSKEAWHASFMRTVMSLLGSLYGDTWVGFLQRTLLFQSASDTYAKLLLKYDVVYSACFRDFATGTTTGIDACEEHIYAIKRYAASQDRAVLEHNVKDGWEPLVRFLGVDEPDQPFPALNDAQYYQTGTRKIKALLLFGVAVQTILLGLAGIMLWYVCRWFLS